MRLSAIDTGAAPIMAEDAGAETRDAARHPVAGPGRTGCGAGPDADLRASVRFQATDLTCMERGVGTRPLQPRRPSLTAGDPPVQAVVVPPIRRLHKAEARVDQARNPRWPGRKIALADCRTPICGKPRDLCGDLTGNTARGGSTSKDGWCRANEKRSPGTGGSTQARWRSRSAFPPPQYAASAGPKRGDLIPADVTASIDILK